MKVKELEFDIVIVGSGLAGQYVALNLSDKFNVAIIAKDLINVSNSNLAQGGIAAEIKNDDERFSKHIEDTIIAGSALNNKDALETLVKGAPENIKKLIELGVKFDLDAEGNISMTREGGHQNRRILHVGGDSTGQGIMEALTLRMKEKENITIFEKCMAVDLVHENNKCLGIKCIGPKEQSYVIYSNFTILATGGVGEIFKYSTNPKIATGDGVAIAARSDVAIDDMEFIQFHPTAFFKTKRSTLGTRFLISEAVRGEGGLLRNVDGRLFMEKYHHLRELAPRDIVSQSIYREMYDTWSEYVYLDTTHLEKGYVKKRFPNIYANCKKNGYDMEKDLIPVAPVQHYSIGGVVINLDGQTSMKNLFANGECASSGVHGANRLASNSLLECIVFGKRITNKINSIGKFEITKKCIHSKPKISRRYKYTVVRKDIKNTMDKYVGIVRSKEGLEIALNIIGKHYENLVSNMQETKYYYEILNMAQTALLIIEAAISRIDSIGCHFRIN